MQQPTPTPSVSLRSLRSRFGMLGRLCRHFPSFVTIHNCLSNLSISLVSAFHSTRTVERERAQRLRLPFMSRSFDSSAQTICRSSPQSHPFVITLQRFGRLPRYRPLLFAFLHDRRTRHRQQLLFECCTRRFGVVDIPPSSSTFSEQFKVTSFQGQHLLLPLCHHSTHITTVRHISVSYINLIYTF
jgi:hypothetical protein